MMIMILTLKVNTHYKLIQLKLIIQTFVNNFSRSDGGKFVGVYAFFVYFARALRLGEPLGVVFAELYGVDYYEDSR